MSRQMLGPHRPPSPAAERPRGGLAVGKHPSVRDVLGLMVVITTPRPKKWPKTPVFRNPGPVVAPGGKTSARLSRRPAHGYAVGCFTTASSVLVGRHWCGGVGFSLWRENPTFGSHGVRPPPRRLPNKKNDKSYGIPRISVVYGLVCQNLGGLVGPPATIRNPPGIPLGSPWDRGRPRPALDVGS